MNDTIESAMPAMDSRQLCQYLGNVLEKLFHLTQSKGDTSKIVEGIIIARTLQKQLEQQLDRNEACE